jgi:hypothetical protein
VVTTSRITTLARIIKRSVERGMVTVDKSEVVEFTVEGNVKTEAGKEWYYSTVSQIEASGDSMRDIKILLVELANLKFKDENGSDVTSK